DYCCLSYDSSLSVYIF
nr:immunoglobulin light chain junction region [Macaca mulatta]